MAAFRAQAHRLLQRMQVLCIDAEASSGGMLQPISLLQSSQPHSTAGAESAAVKGSKWLPQGQSADGVSPQHSLASSNGSLWQRVCQREAAAAVPPAGDMLWAPHGLHSLQPAIAAALVASVSSEAAAGPHCSSVAVAPVQQWLPAASEQIPQERDGDAAHEAVINGELVPGVVEFVKREYQPSVIIRKRRHGFLARLRSKGGQRVLARRRLKGRWKKTA